MTTMQYQITYLNFKTKISIRNATKVMFLAYYPIKSHVPPFVKTPANFFKFTSCEDSPRVKTFCVSLYY